MNTDRIYILDKAYCDHVAFTVSYNFKFQLLPSENRFLNKNLSYQGCLKTSCTYCLEFFLIIYKSATGTAHGVGRTKNNGISQFICNLQGMLYRIGNVRSCHTYSKFVHGILELDSVFTTLDRINLYTDYLNTVLI